MSCCLGAVPCQASSQDCAHTARVGNQILAWLCWEEDGRSLPASSHQNQRGSGELFLSVFGWHMAGLVLKVSSGQVSLSPALWLVGWGWAFLGALGHLGLLSVPAERCLQCPCGIRGRQRGNPRKLSECCFSRPVVLSMKPLSEPSWLLCSGQG